MSLKSSNIRLSNSLSTTYGLVDGLSLQNLFYTKFEIFPFCYMFANSDNKTSDSYIDVNAYLEYIKQNVKQNVNQDEDFQYVTYTTFDIGTKEENIGVCVIFNKSRIFARIEKSIYETYILYDVDNSNNLQTFIDDILSFYVKPEVEKNNFYKIAESPAGFYLAKAKLKEFPDFSVDKLYNDDFKHEDEKIRKFIEKENKSGLIILHGDVGTGKSSYIRNIIASFPEKKFVLVTPDLMQSLGKPAFTNFVSTLEEHIIILEDCENVIRDRKSTGANSAVSTLLNMSDGILGDSLSIKFICTFNENIKDIDKALMRKGRLISKYEFKNLCVEKTNNLLADIYKDNEVIPHSDKPMSLADIFNYEDDSYQIERKNII